MEAIGFLVVGGGGAAGNSRDDQRHILIDGRGARNSANRNLRGHRNLTGASHRGQVLHYTFFTARAGVIRPT